MSYLTVSELSSHIYPEIIDEIIRNDETIAKDAIESAIDMAKSYLHKYDLLALFGDETTAATIKSAMLKRKVKDMSCWYCLILSNANIDLALFDKINDNALRWLRDIQAGKSNPDWSYHDTTTDGTPAQGDAIYSQSNTKRENHW